MKKLRAKLKNILKNQGSGLVLVVVAVAFIGILVGSLLTAVGYAYRLKLYDYNAKDNFYYLEIAMDEVYAGVGNTTMTCLQDAYTKTIEDMVRYDTTKKEYVTIDKKAAYSSFVNSYKTNLAGLSFINSPSSTDLDEFLSSFISNSDVEVVPGKASIVKNTDPNSNVIYTIKNVTLTRTGEYKRSQASGEFEQTISADVVIQNPDFMINFEKQGGIAFFLIYYTGRYELYYLPLEMLRYFWDRAKAGGRKSFRHDELNPDYIIPKTGEVLVPYLEKLQQDLNDR